jgi:hypothetical protein
LLLKNEDAQVKFQGGRNTNYLTTILTGLNENKF